MPGIRRPRTSGHARRGPNAAIALEEFSRWFSLTVEALQPPDGVRWNFWLSEVMTDEGNATDETYLRRVAKGERLPGLELTYRIGEGLRAAGLPWCSGVYALLHHRQHIGVAYAILDITSRDTSYALALEWVEWARSLGGSEMTLAVMDDERAHAEQIRTLRAQLAHLTKRLSARFERSWAEFRRVSIGRAHGIFGGLYLISSNPEFEAISYNFIRTIEKAHFDRLTLDEQRLVKAPFEDQA